MALGEASGIVGVVYRVPSRLVLVDSASGTAKADLSTCDDADDLYFDDKRRRIYVSCGSGAIDVFEQAATMLHLRTSKPDRAHEPHCSFPHSIRLFVAARAGSGRDAALLVYHPAP
jgi:hypothetical protein